MHTHYQRISETVRQVPLGNVATYGQIADLAGLPGRARMVGKYLGQAPESEALPWYRIVRADGQLAFPQGSAQALLQTGLLQEENVVVINNRVRLKAFLWQPDLAELLWKLRF